MGSKKHLQTLLKIVLTLAGFWFAYTKIEWSAFALIFKQTNPWYIIAAIALYILGQIVSSERLRIILTSVPDKLAFWPNLRLYFVGMAYNLFLPGGIGGDAYKVIVYKNRSGIASKPYVVSLLADRLIGMVGILILLIISMCLSEFSFWYTKPWVLGLIPIGIVTCYFIVHRWFPKLKNVLWSGVGLSLIVQLCQMLAVYIIAMSFEANVAVNFFALSAVFLLSTLATAVPVFMGGLGAREVVFALMFTQFQWPEEVGVAIAACFSMVVVISSLPGLILRSSLKSN